MEPQTSIYTGADPLGLVLRLNMHRRQLTVAQRAIVAAEMIRRKREIETGEPGAEEDAGRTDTPLPGVEDAAKALGISPRSVSAALRVFKEGTEELCEAVKRGDIRVSAAEQVTKLDQDQQRALSAVWQSSSRDRRRSSRHWESRHRSPPCRSPGYPVL